MAEIKRKEKKNWLIQNNTILGLGKERFAEEITPLTILLSKSPHKFFPMLVIRSKFRTNVTYEKI